MLYYIRKTHFFQPETGREGLTRLDMLVPEAPGSSGLVFIDGVPRSHAEYIALEKARKYDVDAVYFRRFESGSASIPQIYIYDFTSKEENKDEIGELHRKLWNSGQVPLFFIFTKTEITIRFSRVALGDG